MRAPQIVILRNGRYSSGPMKDSSDSQSRYLYTVSGHGLIELHGQHLRIYLALYVAQCTLNIPPIPQKSSMQYPFVIWPPLVGFKIRRIRQDLDQFLCVKVSRTPE